MNIGQAILECEICNIAIHTKCFDLANFCNKNDIWVCNLCADNFQPRYNPFHVSKCHENDDKFYENDNIDVDNKLQAISNVLDSCKSYSTSEIQQAIKNATQLSSVSANRQKPITASSLFVNIDGNSTNFDNFLLSLNVRVLNSQSLGWPKLTQMNHLKIYILSQIIPATINQPRTENSRELELLCMPIIA